MGHKYGDLDSVGAGVGICAIARKRGKRANIILDPNKNFAQPLIRKMRSLPEYEGTFITVQDAFTLIRDDTLMIVVDTNRPEQAESEALLDSCKHVVVIDHHRRAASYIDDMVLNFHEPYASSACELVTELWQYLLQNSDILRYEAEALLAGIVMDTKNFTLRTGSRTFDAAAYLRRIGSDTSEVKKMMQNDFNGTVEKYKIIQGAKMYGNGIAIAATETIEDRVVAAQAADELLNISGVHTSFVVFLQKDAVIISARSIGKINVQVVLEELGGGGNRSTAGAQIRDKSFGDVYSSLLSAIDEYLSDKSNTETVKE
jgi:Predicted signaling protein consisting of a modified GGDEF domain and a DHH domain